MNRKYKNHYGTTLAAPLCKAKFGYLVTKDEEEVTCCICKDILKQIEADKLPKPHKRIPF